MNAKEIVAAYLDALEANPSWAETYRQSNALYAPLATAALVKAGFAAFLVLIFARHRNRGPEQY
jgi:hypothetical protein